MTDANLVAHDCVLEPKLCESGFLDVGRRCIDLPHEIFLGFTALTRSWLCALDVMNYLQTRGCCLFLEGVVLGRIVLSIRVTPCVIAQSFLYSSGHHAVNNKHSMGFLFNVSIVARRAENVRRTRKKAEKSRK